MEPPEETVDFDFTQLPEPIRRALDEAGYETPTPIQTQAIPPALAGSDLIGIAQTGTGKTAAFSLPILSRLSTETYTREPRALVLAPTRELAQQVVEFAESYGKYLKFRVCCIVGGVAFGPQLDRLNKGCDLVVATPGRLLDLERQGALRLHKIEILVLDEADRMLDMGFMPDVRRILRMIPTRRQTLLFSATFPPEIERLSADFLRDPVRVTVGATSTPVENVRQRLFLVDFQKKGDLLQYLLRDSLLSRVLVFTRTKMDAEIAYSVLRRADEDVAVIHGDRTQAQRNRALEDFAGGKARILVATDVASRGLDIPMVSHVVNFDMPHTVEDYIHRIGRTARAGEDGDAWSFVSSQDFAIVRDIQRTTGLDLPREIVPGFEPTRGRFLIDSKPAHASVKRVLGTGTVRGSGMKGRRKRR